MSSPDAIGGGTVDIELSAEDFSLLKRVLERAKSDLRMEIAGTENAGWRKDMHADEDRMTRLIAEFDRASAAEDDAGQLLITVRGFVVQLS